jgi:hypothetical protein
MQRMIDEPAQLRAFRAASAAAGHGVWDWSRFQPRLLVALAAALPGAGAP